MAAPMTMSDKRQRVIDFTTPYMDFQTTILYKKMPGADPIKSVTELADQSEIKYGLVRGGSTENFFKTSQKNPYNKMWSKISGSSNNVDQVEEGVEKVRSSDGKYAFIIEGTTADYWTSQEPCDLVKIGPGISKNHYGFAMRQGDNLKGTLDPVINEMVQNGDLQELKKKWWQDKSECTSGVAPHQVVSIFIVLCAAVATRITL